MREITLPNSTRSSIASPRLSRVLAKTSQPNNDKSCNIDDDDDDDDDSGSGRMSTVLMQSNDLSSRSSRVNLEHKSKEKESCSSKFTIEEQQDRSLGCINTMLIHRIQQSSSILNNFLDDSNILNPSDHVKFKLPQNIQEEIKDDINSINQCILRDEDFQKLKNLSENIENYYQKIVKLIY